MATSSTDIVERLRAPRPDAHPSAGAADMADIDNQRREAADEIVKLRSSLFRIQNLLQNAYPPLDQCIRETLEALEDE